MVENSLNDAKASARYADESSIPEQKQGYALTAIAFALIAIAEKLDALDEL
jgi:hypothetical protein